MKFEARTTGRRLARVLLGGIACLPLLTARAHAVEFFDGAVQLHGFVEFQLRTIAKNYNNNDGWELTQWYNVLNLEGEFDIAPDGFGPFDHLSAFVRVEARYDCVWTQGCMIMPHAEAYGNRAKKLPVRLSDGHKSGFIAAIDPVDPSPASSRGPQAPFGYSDKRNRIRIPIDELGDEFGVGGLGLVTPDQRSLGRLWNVPGVGDLLFAGLGPDGAAGTSDDPGLYLAARFLDDRFALEQVRGPTGGNATRIGGPWRPKDKVPERGGFSDRANPLSPLDVQPVLGLQGGGELPFRPAPLKSFDSPAAITEARGVYYPNSALNAAYDNRRFGLHDLNFSQVELAFNHGGAQQDEYELKEAYIDFEMFDHRLWGRLGKQTIVWGKTEIFRAQDQFNPQDLGLASLPSLEESRIPLWAARLVYSLYDVGPLTDVRLELAMNFDDFEPTDIGSCGEPYAVPQACDKAFGFYGHALTGTGIAGENRPPQPWNDIDGIEWGARVEFRYGRFSFAITNFRGYGDLPVVQPVWVSERNVDPFTGRPRSLGARGRCDPDGLLGTPDTSGCLGMLPFVVKGCYDDPDNPGEPGPFCNPDHLDDVLLKHHANQTLFTAICASTVGSNDLLPEACAFNIWNSTQDSDDTNPLAPTLAGAFSAMLAGSSIQSQAARGVGPALRSINGHTIAYTLGRFTAMAGGIGSADPAPGLPPPPNPCSVATLNGYCDEDDIPLVPLDFAPGDADPDNSFYLERAAANGFTPSVIDLLWRDVGLSASLSDQQEALLGCGPYWGTHCDVDGFDMMNSEASALLQSWPGFEGTGFLGSWDTFATVNPNTGARLYQPGTVDANDPAAGFQGGPVCTRYVEASGELVTLPGCHGPGDPGYDPAIDGVPPNAFDPDNPMALPRADTVSGGLVGDRAPDFVAAHPFTGDFWRSEMAALSFNLLMTFVTTSLPADRCPGGDVAPDPECPPPPGGEPAGDGISDFNSLFPEGRFDEFDPRDPFSQVRCSYRTPLICKNVSGLLATSGQLKNTLRAGGNGRFGRRDFAWHAGATVALNYRKRNVFGVSADFAEDWSKTNWNAEFTWFDRVPMVDHSELDGLRSTSHYNLALSVDRPTFIRFMNKNRVMFFNAQLFLQYIDGYRDSFTSNGKVNMVTTLTATTAYHQDRLITSITWANDLRSRSGAVLPSVAYRYSQSFTIEVGLGIFYGRTQKKEAALTPLGTFRGGAGLGAQNAYVENGLSAVRDRDEIYMRLRYTF